MNLFVKIENNNVKLTPFFPIPFIPQVKGHFSSSTSCREIYSSSDGMKKCREILKKKLEHLEKFNNEGNILSNLFSASIQ